MLAKRQARIAARDAKRWAVQQPTEPIIDESDDTERPLAVAAKLEQDKEYAAKQQQDAQDSREWAAEARREAAEARKAKKAEAEVLKRKQREEAAAYRAKLAAEKAEADAAKHKERDEAAEAKAVAKRESDEAKAAAKRDALRSKAAHRADDDDIVEAPREPKKSVIERLKPAQAAKSDGSDGESAPSKLIPTIAVVVGALGFVFSVILAIGAFMVALNPQDDGGLFNLVSNICDALVGPLGGLFSFSGDNGESKDALVAWGLGALGYLVIGLVVQSLLRSRSEEG